MSLINYVIAVSVGLIMLYSGMLLSWSSIRATLIRANYRPLFGISLINFALIPLLTYAGASLLPKDSTIHLTLIVLAILPCAPLVPSLASFTNDPPDWASFIFFTFSAFSLLLVVLTTLGLTRSGHTHNDHNALYNALFRYCLAIYLPMVIGFSLRAVAPDQVQRLVGTLRPLAGLALLFALAGFAAAHFAEIQKISRLDLAVLLTFQAACLCITAPLSRRFAGPPVTRILATGFRNAALALPFSLLVLERPDVSAYIVVYGATIFCASLLFIALVLYRQRHPRVPPLEIPH